MLTLPACCLPAEAAPASPPNVQRVWEGSLHAGPIIVKQRFSKQYRHPLLDAKLTVSRLKQEVRSMMRARKLGVRTPGAAAAGGACHRCAWPVEPQRNCRPCPAGTAVLHLVDHVASCIYMERVEGHSIKALLQQRSLAEAGARHAHVVFLGVAWGSCDQVAGVQSVYRRSG